MEKANSGNWGGEENKEEEYRNGVLKVQTGLIEHSGHCFYGSIDGYTP